MKKSLLLLISIILLIVGCSSKSLTDRELEETYKKRNKAYGDYLIMKRDKVIVLEKKRKVETKKEKDNLDNIFKDLKDKMNLDEFLELVSNEKSLLLERTIEFTESQVNELKYYFNIHTKTLVDKFAVLQKEKADNLAKLEEEKLVANNQRKLEQFNKLENEVEVYKVENNKEITPTYKNGILIVNKKNPLPSNYSPGEDPKAVSQLKNMIIDMQNLGYDISKSYSGFRTYSVQKNLYERYVSRDGRKAADTYSARPGHSEHQTGLTYDLKHNDGTLVQKDLEVKWLSINAADYGFIVRYQKGKEGITGYQAEPWHLRYIGEESLKIYNSGLSLEEYLDIPGGDYFD